MFSPKDIPFMSIWLLCTFLIFNCFEKLIKDKSLLYSKISLFAFFTGFLFSIRVTGVLILFQYLITFFIFSNFQKFNFVIFTKKFYKNFYILFFCYSLFIF